MGQSSHSGESSQTQNQNNAVSHDPKDGDRLIDKPRIARTPAEKVPPNDEQDQATVEDFDREGMGVAGKE